MLKVISLWAGPGAGKSTTAAAIFVRMKRLRFNVELVTELAKDYTYEKNWARLRDQRHMLSEQSFRLKRLEGQVEYAITDSPLPLSLVYCDPEEYYTLVPLVNDQWSRYQNMPFILQRTEAPYITVGRKESEEEARTLDQTIHDLAVTYGAKKVLNPDASNVEDQVIREVNSGILYSFNMEQKSKIPPFIVSSK